MALSLGKICCTYDIHVSTLKPQFVFSEKKLQMFLQGLAKLDWDPDIMGTLCTLSKVVMRIKAKNKNKRKK